LELIIILKEKATEKKIGLIKQSAEAHRIVDTQIDISTKQVASQIFALPW